MELIFLKEKKQAAYVQIDNHFNNSQNFKL